MTPEELGLSEEDRERLDALAPAARHAVLDTLHRQQAIRASMRETSEHVARLTDGLVIDMGRDLPYQDTDEQREALLDLMTSLTLSSESLQAFVRLDLVRGGELSELAQRYREQARRRHAGGLHRRPRDAD